jgi:phytoene dehydrogenase-like protein
MPKKLIVIGAGTAGLTAGIYAARSGYQVQLLEMDSTPGGLCTSWRRDGYRFDASSAGLAGTSPDAPIHHLWEDLGVFDYCPLYDPEDFGSILGPDGQVITIYTDIDRLEGHLLEAFPTDRTVIGEFGSALRSATRLDIPYRAKQGLPGMVEGIAQTASSLRSLPLLLKYGRLTLRQLTHRLRDPFCFQVFNNLVHFGGPDVPLLTVLLPLAYSHRHATGIPVHGWLSFARALERRFRELGGEVRYGSRVEALRRVDGRVSGVVLAGGGEDEADLVLSAVDGRFTRSVLLGETEDNVDRSYRAEGLSDQPVQVNLGVARDPSSAAGSMTYLLDDGPSVAGRRQWKVTLHTNRHDPGAAPEGKSAVTAFLESDYGFWRALHADSAAYDAEKQACAQLVIDAAEKHEPGFASKVEVIDVSTPITRERYTGNWMGAMQARKPDASMIKAMTQGSPRYDYPGLEGFWMAGQWVESWGGITTAARSGRNAIQRLCKRDGVPFR